MGKRLFILIILLSLITLLAGCGSNKDKTALVELLQSINEENTDIFIVDYNGSDTDDELLAKVLSMEETQILTDIFGRITEDHITPDEHPFEIPPVRYVIMMNDREKQYKDKTLNMVSLNGDFKIYHNGKDWKFKSEELGKYILSFYES